MIGIQQQALFSGRPVADSDRARVAGFVDELVRALEQRSGRLQRLRLRRIDCVI